MASAELGDRLCHVCHQATCHRLLDMHASHADIVEHLWELENVLETCPLPLKHLHKAMREHAELAVIHEHAFSVLNVLSALCDDVFESYFYAACAIYVDLRGYSPFEDGIVSGGYFNAELHAKDNFSELLTMDIEYWYMYLWNKDHLNTDDKPPDFFASMVGVLRPRQIYDLVVTFFNNIE